jgi:hypothetical protein
MSDILERVYSFFLQEATSVAQLGAYQLAFERYSDATKNSRVLSPHRRTT